MEDLASSIHSAWERRDLLHGDPDLNTYRLFHGYSEGRPGFVIDRYGDVALLSNKDEDRGECAIAVKALQSLGDFSCIAVKECGGEARALIGALPSESFAVVEDGLQYTVEVWAAGNPGLYLDARPARRWIRENAEGRRILNLFSFAGSLGVAAMAGGARSVVHVDTQKRALKRCEANHRLNEQSIDHRDLACEDVIAHLRSAHASGRRFGGVIVDPPPIKEGSPADLRGLTVVGLASQVAKVLDREAWMLCFFHHDPHSWDELEAAVIDASERPLEVLWRGQAGVDHFEPDERRSLRLSALRLGSV